MPSSPDHASRGAADHRAFRREVEANPNSAEACNNLAWAYLGAPEALRHVEAALPLAEKAVRLAAGNAVYRNTLGVAYYRAGRYREAVEVLRPNLETQEDSTLAYDLYFLAMSHHRMGETARARDYYDCAVRWSSRGTQPRQGPARRARCISCRNRRTFGTRRDGRLTEESEESRGQRHF